MGEPFRKQIYVTFVTMKHVLIASVLSIFSWVAETNAQIAVTTGCSSTEFGGWCNFNATGTLGNYINWKVSGGEWNWVVPRNPGPFYDVDTDKTSMTAICRRYPAWYRQYLTVTISSNGYSASVEVPFKCYAPQLGESTMKSESAKGLNPASAMAIAQFGDAYGSYLPGSGTVFVQYPNGWEYLENGEWKSLVVHAGGGESPTGVKIFAFKQCLLIDSTPWTSKESKLYFKTIPKNFPGLTIRKWVERCEGEMAYGPELVIPSAVTMGNNPLFVNAIQAWAMPVAENAVNLCVSDSLWKVVAVVSMTGQTLNWKQTEDGYIIQSHSMPGTIRVGVSNGQACHWINPHWVH